MSTNEPHGLSSGNPEDQNAGNPEAPNIGGAVRIVTIGEESILIAKLPRKVPEDTEQLIGEIKIEPPKGGGGWCCDSLCGIAGNS
ncbi:MAG TPA: hypothetical protein VE956_06125 [Nodularia sp. (in: cyanobacteria)]|nr:hypothetical protein [Nodularia sp. (in: cyanobacteria)]